MARMTKAQLEVELKLVLAFSDKLGKQLDSVRREFEELKADLHHKGMQLAAKTDALVASERKRTKLVELCDSLHSELVDAQIANSELFEHLNTPLVSKVLAWVKAA